jgi:hypothetical protein
MNDKEKQKLEAASKEVRAKAAENTGEVVDTGSGVSVDENVDVSDDALAKARVAEKVAEENPTAKEEDKPNPSANVEDDSPTNELDETTAAILETLKVEKKDETPTGQTPEQKIAELERKNKKLYEENQKIKTQPEYKPVPPSTPQGTPQQPQMTKEQYAAWVEEKYNMDMDEFQKQMKFTKDYIEEFVLPEFKGLRDKIKTEDIR